MQFFSIIAASLLATVAIASPTPDAAAAAELQTRASPMIDLWQDAGFLGLKFTGSSNVGTCNNLAGTGFNNNVSAGRAKPGFRCTTWVDANCVGTGFSFNNAGASQFPSWIDNKSSSWKCVAA